MECAQPPLGRSAIHVWLAVPEKIQSTRFSEACSGLLSEEECGRYRSFRFDKHRHAFLVTRVLQRTTLSRYGDLAPREWRFVRNEYGRPELVPGQNRGGLRFNLSRTEGLVACAVTRGPEVGVDVEVIDRTLDTEKLADEFFSPYEARALRARPDATGSERFFEYWTLKEAYIKARGVGLSLPLDRFSLHLDEEGPIRISFRPPLADDPCAWHFALRRPTPRHVLAIAGSGDAGTPPKIDLRWTVSPTGRGPW